jgi:adenosine deaminase
MGVDRARTRPLSEFSPGILSLEHFRAIPKIDLHRHLEGSLRLTTLLEIGRQYGLDIPNTSQLRALVQIREDEAFTFQNFLSKFQTLRKFFRSPEIIGRLTREVIADAAADSVRYLELRFTPIALSRSNNLSLGEVIDQVSTSTRQADRDFNIRTRLIVSVNRHEGPDLAAQVVEQAIQRMDNGLLVGLDLAGDETSAPVQLFAGVFREARQAGLHITIHAGEWGGPQNIAEAVTVLGAERIGHGIRVLEDPAVTAFARQQQLVFEVCVTSNYHSGVVPALAMHPLPRMAARGLIVTINTDDPSICQVNLSEEYRRVRQEMGFSEAMIKTCIDAAVSSAFIPQAEKTGLADLLKQP